MNRKYVLDASAMLNWLTGEPGAERVEQLFRGADRFRTPLPGIGRELGEVFYLSWQRHGELAARAALANLALLPIRVLPVDQTHALKAGELKALHKIPYVDCLAAALALLHQATLVTSDRDFERLGKTFSYFVDRTVVSKARANSGNLDARII